MKCEKCLHKKVCGKMPDAATEVNCEDFISESEVRTMKNELCLICGKYVNRHNGACDGCRWLEAFKR